jgi:hypothetical protein
MSSHQTDFNKTTKTSQKNNLPGPNDFSLGSACDTNILVRGKLVDHKRSASRYGKGHNDHNRVGAWVTQPVFFKCALQAATGGNHTTCVSVPAIYTHTTRRKRQTSQSVRVHLCDAIHKPANRVGSPVTHSISNW